MSVTSSSLMRLSTIGRVGFRAPWRRPVRTASMSISRMSAAVLPLLNRYARVPVCGLIAHYNDAKPADGSPVAETMLTVLRRSILIRGFINTQFAVDHYDSFLKELGPLVRSADIRYRGTLPRAWRRLRVLSSTCWRAGTSAKPSSASPEVLRRRRRRGDAAACVSRSDSYTTFGPRRGNVILA
jgi:hypothetical protein